MKPIRIANRAKVEACVLIVERYLLGRLRHRHFYSLAELNQTIQKMLIDINEQRPLRRLGVTRRQLFEDLDLPALKPLPVEPYVYAEWRVRRGANVYRERQALTSARLSRGGRGPLLQRALSLRQ
jgi:hypothetical protein